MISVNVLADFYDLKAHKWRRKGNSFKATDERAAQLRAVLPGYTSSEEEPKEVESPQPEVEKVEAPKEQDLSKLTNPQLKALCEQRGIAVPKRAKKEVLLALLKE